MEYNYPQLHTAMIWDTIAARINSLLGILSGLTKLSALGGGLTGTSSVEKEGTPVSTEGQKPARSAMTGKRALITIPEQIGARFNSTGSPAWANQPGGRHYGTDFLAAQGSPVFAPYPMHIVKIGHYSDSGRMGDYVIGTLADGVEYYSGHLEHVKVKVGDVIEAGAQLGETNVYNHTHIQLKVNGVLTDFEEYSKG